MVTFAAEDDTEEVGEDAEEAVPSAGVTVIAATAPPSFATQLVKSEPARSRLAPRPRQTQPPLPRGAAFAASCELLTRSATEPHAATAPPEPPATWLPVSKLSASVTFEGAPPPPAAVDRKKRAPPSPARNLRGTREDTAEKRCTRRCFVRYWHAGGAAGGGAAVGGHSARRIGRGEATKCVIGQHARENAVVIPSLWLTGLAAFRCDSVIHLRADEAFGGQPWRRQ